MIDAINFTAGNLNGANEFEWAHNHNTTNVICKWYDEIGIERGTLDLLQVVDANNIILRCGEAISGTHKLVMEYQVAGEATAGRRLFELATTEAPAESLRLSLGKASTPASNITLTAFLAWLMTKLGFLKVTNNLSDLQDVATARASLAVYSQTQVDQGLATKATVYQAASGPVIGINNTAIYNPASNYNPAVLRNVKNIGHRTLLAGSVSADGTWQDTDFLNTDVLDLADITSVKNSSGKYTITHNIGHSDYFVRGQAVGGISAMNRGVAKVVKANNSFLLYIGDDGGLGDSDFEFEMFDYFTYSADE